MNHYLAAELKFEPITGPQGTISPTAAGIESLLTTAFGVLTIIGGLMFIIWVIVGAYNWLTAEGAPDKIEKARNHIIQAITGLIILVGAYGIAAVLGAILGFDIFDLQKMLGLLK